MITIFNILPGDKVTTRKAETRFIKLDVTHSGCQEPFLQIYIHRDQLGDIIKALESK